MPLPPSHLSGVRTGLLDVTACLTWNKTMLGPFESAWSLFFKVCHLNYLSMPALMALICKKDTGPYPSALAEAILDSSWVDFTRFAQLLGVESDRLRECFLDELGLSPIQATGYGIRSCPKCAEHGYHCTLFDLAIVKECPWHKIELSQACLTCATMSAISGTRHIVPFDKCPHCKQTRSWTLFEAAQKEFTATERDTIRAFCENFIDWKGFVEDALPRAMLTEDLNAVGRQKIDTVRQQLQLGLAADRSHRMPRWKLALSPMPAMLGIWKQGEVRRPYSLCDQEIITGTVSTYKAIRRQIAKRYLCGHAACLSEVMRLKRSESLYVAGDRICPVAFAYVIWRMSVEGVIDIEQLRRKRVISSGLRLHGGRDSVSMDEQPHRLYAWFLAIWGVTTLLGPRDRYELRIEGPVIYDALPTCCIVEDVRSERCLGHVFALVPNSETMRILSKQQCKRWPHSRSIVWGERFWSETYPASYSTDERKYVAFKVRAVHAIALSQYYQVLRI